MIVFPVLLVLMFFLSFVTEVNVITYFVIEECKVQEKIRAINRQRYL